jgi:ankyrin repeat protein
MLSIQKRYIQSLIILLAISISGNVYSQPKQINQTDYDTSSYIPYFYFGALDYNLMIAASKGYSKEINRLIKKGADVNSESNDGVTPLIYAVSNNKAEVVKLLIENGANVNKITSTFETPLLISVKNQNMEITEVLIRAEADIDFSDEHGATSLHYASIYGNFQMVDLLLYYNESIDKKTEDGTTPLMAAIMAGYADIADILIQNGANMEARDNEGFTPFLTAALNGDTLLMDMLYKKGVNIYETNNSKHNALTLSIITDNQEATQFLLRLGDKWTNSGDIFIDPYVVAAKYKRKDMVNILKNHNVPGDIKYEIDQVSIGVSSRLWIHDLYTGISLSFKEPYLNAGILAGFDTKLWYSRVLIKDSENLYHQYMNKGSMAYAGLFKDFALTDRLNKFNIEFSTSLLAGYLFGNELKGTIVKPENKFIAIPSVSLKFVKMNFTFSTGLEYIKTDFYQNGPVWLRIGCSYNHYFDKVRTRFKTIKWY